MKFCKHLQRQVARFPCIINERCEFWHDRVTSGARNTKAPMRSSKRLNYKTHWSLSSTRIRGKELLLQANKPSTPVTQKRNLLFPTNHHHWLDPLDGFMFSLREPINATRYPSSPSSGCCAIEPAIVHHVCCLHFVVEISQYSLHFVCLPRSCPPKMYLGTLLYELVAVSCPAFYCMYLSVETKPKINLQRYYFVFARKISKEFSRNLVGEY